MRKVAFYAPGPMRGSGGVGRIYNFAKALSKSNYECHVFVTNSNGRDAAQLAREANDFYGATGFICHPSTEVPSGVFDLAIATQWETAILVQRMVSHAKAYLIQDFEAYFNPVGDGSVFAENSYIHGLRPLTYGRWLAHKLETEFGSEPFFFEFASNNQVFRCQRPMKERLEGPARIAFVFQGDKARRCPRLGIEALGIVKHYRPDAEILFVGSAEPPHLWYDFQNLGNLTIQELNRVYNECCVGLSLSSTNPSCNPFDMMAAGLPSVDLYRQNNLFDTPSKGVLLALQTPESVAEAILHLLNNPKELLKRSEFGIKFMKSRPQEREVKSFLAAVDAIMRGQGHGGSRAVITSLFYDNPPVVAKVDRNAYSASFLQRQASAGGGSRVKSLAHFQYYPTDELRFEAPAPLETEQHLARQAAIEVAPGVRRRHVRILNALVRKYNLDKRLTLDLFDRAYYLDVNHDVMEAGMDPFIHFVRYGHAEGRSPSPYFDAKWYEDTYAAALAPKLSAVDHYLTEGSALNRSPNALFDATWYLARNRDVAEAGLHPLFHFIRYGEAENRDPSEKFSTAWYRTNNLDVVAAKHPLLLHYMHHGEREGRLPVPRTEVRGALQRSAREAALTFENLFDAEVSPRDLEPSTDRSYVNLFEKGPPSGQVSFDIWSTILHRRCHPDEIKLRSARFLLLQAWTDIIPGMRDVVTLMNARMRAENASAPNGDYEYSFNVAVHSWLQNVLNTSCSPERRARLAKSIIAHEFDAERDAIEVDPNTERTIRSLEQPAIFISDFYMSAPFLENLLHSVQLGSAFFRGYVSCDGYQNKRSGALFGKVLKDLNLAPHELTHVGDNPFSDKERPASLGINTISYVSSSDEERLKWYEQAFHALCLGDVSQHERRLLALAKRQSAEASGEMEGEAFDLYAAGCHIGLLAFGYCLNVMQDAIVRQSKEVVFFTREGILFKKIYDLIAEHNPFTTPPPPSKLLSVSRRATFAASLRSFDTEELMRLWTMYWKQSPLTFSASLNLDPAITAAAAKRAGLDPHQVVKAPWTDARFNNLLSDESFRRHAEAELAAQRDLLQRYLAQELAPDQDELLICDIGWRGTIQDNLAHTIGKPVRGHYLALLGYLNEQPAFSSKVGWLSDLNRGTDYQIPDQLAVIEMIFNGLGGSTVGYDVDSEGQVFPVKEIFDGEEAVVRALEPCRAGMTAVVRELARYVNLHGLVAENLQNLGRKIVDDLIASPPSAIANMFAKLEHNETFGAGTLDVMQKSSFEAAIAEQPGGRMHAALTSWLGGRWPEGLSRQDIVQQWWKGATPQERASAPLAITKSAAPAIIRSTGSRLALYLSEDGLAPERLDSVLRTTQGLVDAGFQAEIYWQGDDDITARLDASLGDMPASVITSWSSHRNAGLALATDASSASYVHSNVIAQSRGYLVQDHDGLAGTVDGLVLTENSYIYGLSHFTLGNWLTHMISSRYFSRAFPAGHGVDTAVYKCRSDVKRELAVCMHYPAGQSGPLARLALDALALLKKSRPDVRIILFGAETGPRLSFEYENLGMLRDPKLISDLFNQCAAGLALGMSNPSRMAFEMAAAGCTPVSLYRYNNVMDLGDRFSVLAFQSSRSIAQALSDVLEKSHDDQSYASSVASQLNDRTLIWERDAAVANIIGVLDGKLCASWNPPILYKAEPVIAPADDNAAVRAFCRQQLPSEDRNLW
jgi:O-antigen biosynthesis protein